MPFTRQKFSRQRFDASCKNAESVVTLTVTLYLTQSFQKSDAENFFRITVVAPKRRQEAVATCGRNLMNKCHN